jgi:uncharacterized membrane protein required for colicin V production
MIAEATGAAATGAASAGNAIPINWFDVAILVVLISGLYRGRRNGMSKEIIPFFQWLALVLVCGLGYEAAAPIFTNLGLSKFASNVGGYVALFVVVLIPFMVLRRIFREKIGGSDAFKGSEYYLGMVAGMIRYFCILMVALALLNARHYTDAELKAKKDYALTWYSNDIFPDWNTLQTQVFVESLSGSIIKKNLGLLLIETPVAESKPEPGKTLSQPTPKPTPVIHIGN